MISIVIADDHRFYRQGVRSLLDARSDITVVAEASTGEEALVEIAAHHPDVVLLDIKMPGMGGLQTCGRIRRDHPDVAIVIVTMFDDDDVVIEALRSGAHGYLLKDASVDEVARAVHAAKAGQGIFSPAISLKLAGLVDPARGNERRPANLTQREAQLLLLIAGGHTNGQIAQRLGITTKTVRNILSLTYAKIGVADRTQAAIWTQANLGR